MQNDKTFATTSDQLGIMVSVLCAVHCILTPVLISLSSVFAHLLPGEERTHRILAVGIAVVGAAALVRGFRIHGRVRIVFLMMGGLLCIFFAAYFGDRLPSHLAEVLITLLGSSLMIAAHRFNHTFCRDCRQCAATHQD